MILIKNAHIVNEGETFTGSVLIENDIISKIIRKGKPVPHCDTCSVIDAKGLTLIPGVIDTHVHFRDPGFPEKADFETESRAAVAGGVTSVLDMPNTKPQTTSVEAWQGKMDMAAAKSYCNYGFFIGATNDNLEELKSADYSKICGVKLFLGSSTGGMLVSDGSTLEQIFRDVPALIMVHAEDEAVIAKNKEHYLKLYGDKVPIECHPAVRSVEACYKASSYAVGLAKKYGTRLHVAHVSTEKELELFANKPITDKCITAETCPHYLYFCDLDYKRLGARIKCNPAIKSLADKKSLLRELSSNKIDTIGTDHAPHLLSDKEGYLFSAASGMPSVQFSLQSMINLVDKGFLTIENLVEKMCHNPAQIFRIKDRGFIREGYKADLTLINRDGKEVVNSLKVLSKCGWTPYEDMEFHSSVAMTIVNGQVVYDGSDFITRCPQPLTYGS